MKLQWELSWVLHEHLEWVRGLSWQRGWALVQLSARCSWSSGENPSPTSCQTLEQLCNLLSVETNAPEELLTCSGDITSVYAPS